MNTNKKNLLITLADKNYVAQAKQFFASVFFNSGWQGDYMLLTDDISEEDKNWFEKKGIIVYSPPLLTPLSLTPRHSPLLLSKLYFFTESFKESWNTIIFYDCDVIVRGSLDSLLKYQGFSAPSGDHFRLEDEYNFEEMSQEIREKIDPKKPSFCAGAFTFKTKIITKNTFRELFEMFNNNKKIFKNGDEALFNLYFYNNWNTIPAAYNDPINLLKIKYKIKEKRTKSIAIHFIYLPKPWDKESSYHSEWQENLKLAENINLANRPKAKREIKNYEIILYRIYIWFKKREAKINKKISLKNPLLKVDKQIGKIGLKIKKISPKLYNIIRLKKN
ncbi:hypothetical protein GW758_01395 [Candidatus Falkowbacteria bacterium]|nr:hypothetical protein [Candidatus Falkowbacteria bacterium]